MNNIEVAERINKEKKIVAGHRTCAGCPITIILRTALATQDSPVVVASATSCAEVTTTIYPYTSWNVPWIHSVFANVAATISGVESAYNVLKRKGRIKKEIKFLAFAGDGGCYIPGTKILTEDGFKNVEKITKKDVIWSVNPKNKQMEKSTIIKMHKYNYKEKIVCVNHNFVHFDVSLQHNVPIYNKLNNKIEVIKAQELLNYGRSDKVNIITGDLIWKGKNKTFFELPSVKYNKLSANKKIVKKIKMEDWLEFFGYWISKGHLSKKSEKREKYNVYISQTKKEYVKKVHNCLNNTNLNNWYSQDRFIINNQQLWTYLTQFGKAKDKFIPKEFKELSNKHLKILLDALIVGDGTIIKRKKTIAYSYSTTSPKLKDDVIEIALKLGYRAHLNTSKRKGRYEYAISLSNYKPTSLANLRRKQISSYDYDGEIYCPELKKNHIMIIEKDGRISTNMNSFDIGLQSLSGALERGHDFVYICYDNEGYMNCLSTESLIMTETGLKKITEIKKGEKVWAFDQKSYHPVLKKCTGVFDNGRKKVYEIETIHQNIKATSNHPFLTLKRNGRGKESELIWKTVSELKQNDEIVTIKRLYDKGKTFKFEKIKLAEKGKNKKNNINKVKIPTESSKELMLWLGLYLENGWIREEKGEIGFALPENTKERTKLIKIHKKIFDQSNISKDKYYIYFNSVNISKFINSLEFKQGAKNKTIPSWVFTLPSNQKKEFIKGLIMSDGHIYEKKKESYRYVSVNKDLIERLRLLLQTMDYRVGKITTQKKKKGTLIVNRPLLKDCEYYSICFSEKDKWNLEKYSAQYKYQNFLIKNKYFEIKKIKNIIPKSIEQTLDLRIEGEHNFIANGIVVHNTGNQRSSATPYGASTTTTPSGKVSVGKEKFQKDLAAISIAHNIPYVATANPWNQVDLYNKVKKAFDKKGPALILVFAACPTNMKAPSSQTINISKLATQTNFWPLYEFEDGKYTINYKQDKRPPIEELLKTQTKFKEVLKNKEEIKKIQEHVDEEFRKLLEKEKLTK